MYFQRIGDLREDSDRKQVEVAKYLGVTQSTYSSYERGDINIPVEALIKLADLYDVSLDYLSAVPRTPNGGSRGKRPSFKSVDIRKQAKPSKINAFKGRGQTG